MYYMEKKEYRLCTIEGDNNKKEFIMVGKQDGEYGYHIWNGKDLLTGIKATDNDFFGYGYNRRIEFRDYALTGSRDKTLFIKDSKPISEQKAYRLLRRMSK